jgi:hypothetical protein
VELPVDGIEWRDGKCICALRLHKVSIQLNLFYPCNSGTTPLSIILLEKLTVSQLLKKFVAFYRSQQCVSLFTTAY